MGKTVLVQRFLEGVQTRPPVVVIQGICYQQESVPYKAFDGVVDSLAHFLRRLPDRDAALLVPRNVRELVRLFPVLARVEVLAEASRQGKEVRDPQEIKRRAFGALKELLARLGDRHPLIVFMDDLQWGDLDSALLLKELLWGESQPSMLVIGCYRSEEADMSPMLQELFRGESWTSLEHQKLEVGELSEFEVIELAEMLTARKGIGAQRARALAAESGGVPFLAVELARFMATREEISSKASDELVKLDELIKWRASQLPEQARRLLEVVAVAARPTPVSVCMRASGYSSGELETLATLRSSHLVRVRRSDSGEEIVTYHDRIRESVVATLDDHSLTSCHLNLGENLEGTAEVDPELLMEHFLRAGRTDKAAGYAVQAADLAFVSLAFDRAARLYRLAIELGGKDDIESHDLLVKLGDSLANAYRGPDSAAAYLRATSGQDARTVLDLRHRAAYQFLATGHTEDGIRVARDVLASVGMRLPSYNPFDIVRLKVRRAWVRIRGSQFREHTADEIDTDTLLRVDACSTVGMSMAIADPTFGLIDFATRHVILALQAGEPSRVSLGLSGEGATLGMLGHPRRARRIVKQGRDIAKRIGDPFALGVAMLDTGLVEYWAVGNWRESKAAFDQAIEIFTNECTGGSLWHSYALGFELLTLYYMGNMRELTEKHPILLKDARERRDRCAEFILGETESHNVYHLAADDIEAARTEVKAVFEPTGRENPFYNWHKLAHNIDRELYSGNHLVLRENISSLWSAVRTSQSYRMPLIRSLSLMVYGRGLVGSAMSAEGSDRAGILKETTRIARRLRRMRVSFCPAGSHTILAGAATLTGDRNTALSLVTEAARGFDAANMSLHAEVCRRRQGELLGGDEGTDLIEKANAQMANECIRNPDRWANMIAPGMWKV
jgi:hypothetical protein